MTEGKISAGSVSPGSVSAELGSFIKALEGSPEWIVEIATLIANADGTIDEDEERALVETLESAFHSKLSPMVIRALVGEAIETIEKDGAEARAGALSSKLKEAGKLEPGLGLARAIASSSGDAIGEEEAALIGILSGE